MVYAVISVVNIYGMRELLEVYSIDDEVHPGIGDGKRGVIGALSDDKHPGSSDIWTCSENTVELSSNPGFIHIKWPYSTRSV